MSKRNKLTSFKLKKINIFFNSFANFFYPQKKILVSKEFKKELNLFKKIFAKKKFSLLKKQKKQLKILKINYQEKDFQFKWKIKIENQLLSFINKALRKKKEQKIQKYFFKFILKNSKKWLFWSFPDYFNHFHSKPVHKKYENLLKYFQYFLQNDLLRKFLKQVMKKITNKSKNSQFFYLEPCLKKKDYYGSFGQLDSFHLSNQINHLLPNELIWFQRENLKLIFYKKYIDNELYNYLFKIKALLSDEKISTNKKNKLAYFTKKFLLICVDSSKSMTDIKEIIAKIITLGIVYEMQNYKNYEIVILKFSTIIESLHFLKKIDDFQKLNNFLKTSFQGQTFLENTLRYIINNFLSVKSKKILYDLVIISDFIVQDFSISLKKEISFYKTLNTKIFGIVLGNNYNQKILKNFTDNFFY